MQMYEGFQGVSNCYVFKSQLQEYAQKAGISTPVYETIKEGPSHEPSFKSTVIVNDVRYDSLPGFSNRKLAEQSAAEVALRELSKSGDVNQSIAQPIHETGLCKNLLQEYAQKMNYAIPLYICRKEENPGRVPLFSCTVDIGETLYVGAAARTKKEAEIKVARTALLAIQSSKSESSGQRSDNAELTLLPSKKRRAESNTKCQETANVPKPKKSRFKKRKLKKKLPGNDACETPVQNEGKSEVIVASGETSGVGANPSVNPMGANPSVNPMEANPSVNPMETNPAVNPKEASTAANPKEASTAANPTEAKPSVNPTEANPAVNPTGANPSVIPMVANPSVAPMAGEATPDAHGWVPHVIQSEENQQSVCEPGVAPHVNDAATETGQPTGVVLNQGGNGAIDWALLHCPLHM